MRYMRKLHPYLDILVSNIGEVFVPQNGTHKAKWTFGSVSRGYRNVMIDYKRYLVHRLVAETFLQYPIPDGYEIDHINRCHSDNRVENLRIVTHSENQRNTAQHDRVTEQGRTHKYEDARQADREYRARYRAEHPEKVHEQAARYYASNREKELERAARYQAEHPEKSRERFARYKAAHPEKVREQNARCKQAKRKTHREVRFADGKCRWIPHADAILLLAIPLKERHYHAK